MKENKSLDDSEIDSHIKSYILDPLDKVDQHRPSKPQDIVLYGFGRIGRLVSRIMAQMTGPGNYYRLRAIVVRKGSDTNDLLKRASLLRRDSVHGSFHGTIRVDNETETLVINGNPGLEKPSIMYPCSFPLFPPNKISPTKSLSISVIKGEVFIEIPSMGNPRWSRLTLSFIGMSKSNVITLDVQEKILTQYPKNIPEWIIDNYDNLLTSCVKK